MIKYKCCDFPCYARRLWIEGERLVFYDVEYMIDQILDSQVEHGERLIKRPRTLILGGERLSSQGTLPLCKRRPESVLGPDECVMVSKSPS